MVIGLESLEPLVNRWRDARRRLRIAEDAKDLANKNYEEASQAEMDAGRAVRQAITELVDKDA